MEIYVPPDERFSPKKKSELGDFVSNSAQAVLHFLNHEGRGSKHFESFDEIEAMFSAKERLVIEGMLKEKPKAMVPNKLYKDITHACKKTFKFPFPRIVAGEISDY